jgi:hypothetical protein
MLMHPIVMERWARGLPCEKDLYPSKAILWLELFTQRAYLRGSVDSKKARVSPLLSASNGRDMEDEAEAEESDVDSDEGQVEKTASRASTPWYVRCRPPHMAGASLDLRCGSLTLSNDACTASVMTTSVIQALSCPNRGRIIWVRFQRRYPWRRRGRKGQSVYYCPSCELLGMHDADWSPLCFVFVVLFDKADTNAGLEEPYAGWTKTESCGFVKVGFFFVHWYYLDWKRRFVFRTPARSESESDDGDATPTPVKIKSRAKATTAGTSGKQTRQRPSRRGQDAETEMVEEKSNRAGSKSRKASASKSTRSTKAGAVATQSAKSITRGRRKLPTPPPLPNSSEDEGDAVRSTLRVSPELVDHSSDDLATYSDEPWPADFCLDKIALVFRPFVYFFDSEALSKGFFFRFMFL